MKFTPQLVGAVILVTVSGAISGAHIGTSPVLERGTRDSLPEAPIITASNPTAGSTERPPNHYPLVTPERVVPVGELALHGRLRDSAQAHWMREGRTAARPLEAGYDIEYSDEQLYNLAREEALIAYTASSPQYREGDEAGSPGERAAAPPQSTQPPSPQRPGEARNDDVGEAVATPQTIGKAKVVDVSAELQRMGN